MQKPINNSSTLKLTNYAYKNLSIIKVVLFPGNSLVKQKGIACLREYLGYLVQKMGGGGEDQDYSEKSTVKHLFADLKTQNPSNAATQ